MNTKREIRMSTRSTQQGAALVVGLILLMVLTVLAVPPMNPATLALTMASNAQFHQDAFQAAETGIDIAMTNGAVGTAIGGTGIVLPPTTLGDGSSTTQAVTTFQIATPVPDRAFSIGVGTAGSVSAYHFDVVAQGTGPRNATSTHTQSYYIVGPGGI